MARRAGFQLASTLFSLPTPSSNHISPHRQSRHSPSTSWADTGDSLGQGVQISGDGECRGEDDGFICYQRVLYSNTDCE